MNQQYKDKYEIISTQFGEARIIATQHASIYLDANGFGNGLTVNRVNMRVSAHFTLVDGKWQHNNQYENGYCPQLYTSRKDFGGDVSLAAIRKLRPELLTVVQKWAEANPEALQQAELSSLELKIENKQEKIKELAEEMNVIARELETLIRKLADVKVLK